MESVRTAVFLSVCLSVMMSLCQGQKSAGDPVAAAPDEPVLRLVSHPSDIGSLYAAIHTLKCDVGERCALKHGPRIGRLCDCLRGAACNTFFLRCY
ncbi:cocaine- and amphetamine-regulated transcript 4 [Etheostoma cragini]|uniref:cocaine- and amphetamine-regulated transcript 4 n=1 Tax=Etheostoma cragini TaxID=417921 RepID=UPI00155E93B9|nr:cocaine- and amphetamine-regulated transcript 4 [Etheostoma cragini]